MCSAKNWHLCKNESQSKIGAFLLFLTPNWAFSVKNRDNFFQPSLHCPREEWGKILKQVRLKTIPKVTPKSCVKAEQFFFNLISQALKKIQFSPKFSKRLLSIFAKMIRVLRWSSKPKRCDIFNGKPARNGVHFPSSFFQKLIQLALGWTGGIRYLLHPRLNSGDGKS